MQREHGNLIYFSPSESLAEKLQLVKSTKPHLDKVPCDLLCLLLMWPQKVTRSPLSFPGAVCKLIPTHNFLQKLLRLKLRLVFPPRLWHSGETPTFSSGVLLLGSSQSFWCFLVTLQIGPISCRPCRPCRHTDLFSWNSFFLRTKKSLSFSLLSLRYFCLSGESLRNFLTL